MHENLSHAVDAVFDSVKIIFAQGVVIFYAIHRPRIRHKVIEQADSTPLTRSNNNFLEAFYHTGSFPVNLSGQKSRSFWKSVGQGMFRAKIICINIETPAVYAVERGAMVIGMVDFNAP